MALDIKGLTQDEQFERAAEFAGVPASVLRGMWRVESAEGKRMRSSAGARGHFQIMPKTQVVWEKRTGRKYDPDNFEDGLVLAALTLQENMRAAKGDVTKALRMYNGGWEEDSAAWRSKENREYAGKVLGDDTVVATAAHDVRVPEALQMTEEQVFNTSAHDLLRLQAAEHATSNDKEFRSDIEKGLIAQSGTAAAAVALVQGVDPLAAAVQARRTTDENSADAVRAVTATTAPTGQDDNDGGWDAAIARALQNEHDQAAAETYTTGDKFFAAVENNTLTASLLRAIHRGGDTTVRDPSFNYSAMIEEIEKDRTDDEVDELRENSFSMADVTRIRAEQDARRHRESIIAADSSTAGIIGINLAAGLADPAGWVAGAGVGKVFQLAGVGSRAALQAGKIGKGLSYAGAEGAVGNVLFGAALEAAGEHRSLNDYAIDAGFGFVFGTAFTVPGIRGEVARGNFQRLSDEFKRVATERNARLYERAVAEAGPDATPAEIKVAAERLEREEGDRLWDIAVGEAPEIERLLPRPDANDVPDAPGATGKPRDHLPGSILNTRKKREEMDKRLHLKDQISDDAERKLVREMHARAELLLKEYGIDKERLKPLLSKVGWEATSTRMLNSPNPVMRAAAVILTENPEGAAGRRASAAVTKYMRERVYMGNVIRDYENAYAVWRNRNGGSALRDTYDDTLRRRFDREVYMERDRRFNGKEREADPEVKQASDILDAGYQLMGDDQKRAGTIGHARIAESSRGYSPRMLAPGRVAALTDAERKLFLNALSEEWQLQEGWDKEFADAFAVKYLERAVDKAKGAYDVPANLRDTDSADFVRDALSALSMNEEEIAKIMGRYSRGGASHTKSRIDADLTAEYNGVKLVDLMVTDNLHLFRKYARRVSGEVALAKHGIMGEAGLKVMRKAMQTGPDGTRASAKELEAFDQIAAEFIGKPFGTHLGKWADNARTLTSAIKLGGMGFNQMGEYTNAIAALGAYRAMAAVGGFPRLLKEVRAIARGEKVDNPLLNSLELYGGEIGVDGYRMRGMLDVNDGYEVYGQETLSVLDKAIRLGAHGNRVMSGHRAITAVQTRGIAEQIVMKSLRYIRDGLEDKALADMGITPELAAAIRKDLGAAAKFDGDRVVEFDLTKISDSRAAHAYIQSVHRGAAQIIQDTFIGETGKWAHDDYLKLLTQFRSFSLTATQKQWRRQAYTHGVVKAGMVLLGAMSIVAPIHAARVALRSIGREDQEEFLERELSPVAFGRATMNYVSAIGLLPDVLDIGSAAVGAPVSGGRAANRSPAIGGQVLPAAGVANDAWDVIRNRDPHQAVKLLPGSGNPALQGFINMLDEE